MFSQIQFNNFKVLIINIIYFQDYSSSDSDSSDGGDVKKLPATTKASLNQIFPLSALAQSHEEACLQNFLSKNKDIDENLAADVFRDIKDKLKVKSCMNYLLIFI